MHNISSLISPAYSDCEAKPTDSSSSPELKPESKVKNIVKTEPESESNQMAADDSSEGAADDVDEESPGSLKRALQDPEDVDSSIDGNEAKVSKKLESSADNSSASLTSPNVSGASSTSLFSPRSPSSLSSPFE